MICLEYFSIMLKVATSYGEVNYYPKCELLKITHLAFKDDSMLLARGDVTLMCILVYCLSKFRDQLRLSINSTKSSLYTARIQRQDLG